MILIKQINYTYTELFNNQLDESYPTKYIFENYFVKKDEFDFENYNSKFNLIINKDTNISERISKSLNTSSKNFKKQTKTLFKHNFQEVFDIRKKQFEDFKYWNN